jgi:hypothetical protein
LKSSRSNVSHPGASPEVDHLKGSIETLGRAWTGREGRDANL